ncbi:hypothetical protein AEB_P1092 [Altererythrobacter sp. B11]|nr:hypothetical protein AEB_P1092 [Altererythrobacter sp. B11]
MTRPPIVRHAQAERKKGENRLHDMCKRLFNKAGHPRGAAGAKHQKVNDSEAAKVWPTS